MQIERILLVELQPHRIINLSIADEVCDISHSGQRIALGGADALDQLHLFGLSRLLEASQCIAETVVLAQDVFDCRLVSQEQSHGGKVHLQGQGVLDLLRPVDSFVNLIQELALTGHFGDGLKAYHSHADEEQCDQEKTREQFCMNRGLDGRNPPNQVS